MIREVGFRKADDFYIALGGAKVSPRLVVGKVLQRLKQGEAADNKAERAVEALRNARLAPDAGAAPSSTGSASRASTR